MSTAAHGDTRWFVHDRFGMFIHWGLYSMGARHEWLQHQAEIPRETYEDLYFRRFDPDSFDPDAWADAARDAGMKYFVITAKHHEGFCLWDTAHTDYQAKNTPARRDLLKPVIEAFRKRGLKVGLYYSLIDWHHPDFVLDTKYGPYRNRPEAELARMNEGRDQERYARYMREQVRELLTNYGKIDVLWFDFSYPHPNAPQDSTKGKGHTAWQSRELIDLVRSLQPDIVIDDRLDLPDGWDFKSPEQYQPKGCMMHEGKPVVWEACQTFSGSWGYHRDESEWKSAEMLVKMLVDSVSKGGNLLLNVGPTSRGRIDSRALERLRDIGTWMREHDRSIYGCTAAPDAFICPRDCRLTWNAVTNRLYVHLFDWPFRYLHLEGFAGKVKYAQFLHDGSEVLRPALMEHEVAGGQADAGTLSLLLPTIKPDVPVPVIELFLD